MGGLSHKARTSAVRQVGGFLAAAMREGKAWHSFRLGMAAPLGIDSHMKNSIRFICIGLCCSLPEAFSAETSFERVCAELSARPGNDAERLQELFRADWENRSEEHHV